MRQLWNSRFVVGTSDLCFYRTEVSLRSVTCFALTLTNMYMCLCVREAKTDVSKYRLDERSCNDVIEIFCYNQNV